MPSSHPSPAAREATPAWACRVLTAGRVSARGARSVPPRFVPSVPRRGGRGAESRKYDRLVCQIAEADRAALSGIMAAADRSPPPSNAPYCRTWRAPASTPDASCVHACPASALWAMQIRQSLSMWICDGRWRGPLLLPFEVTRTSRAPPLSQWMLSTLTLIVPGTILAAPPDCVLGAPTSVKTQRPSFPRA